MRRRLGRYAVTGGSRGVRRLGVLEVSNGARAKVRASPVVLPLHANEVVSPHRLVDALGGETLLPSIRSGRGRDGQPGAVERLGDCRWPPRRSATTSLRGQMQQRVDAAAWRGDLICMTYIEAPEILR